MNNRKLIRDISEAILIRCKYWEVCGVEKCHHYGLHFARIDCMLYSPVKYCKVVKGFVYDISSTNLRDKCDPNIAFIRAKL